VPPPGANWESQVWNGVASREMAACVRLAKQTRRKNLSFQCSLGSQTKGNITDLNWEAKQRKNCSNLRKFELANCERRCKLLQVQTKLRSHKSTQLMKTCFYLRLRLTGTSWLFAMKQGKDHFRYFAINWCEMWLGFELWAAVPPVLLCFSA